MNVPCLKCQIGEGQFSGEIAVSGDTSDGDGFSMFCPSEFVEGDPTIGDTEGWVRVTVLAEEGHLSLVKLPRQTLENGLTITVESSQIESRLARQEA